jgi:uncharacterized protein (TIGR04141 family)
MEERYNAQDYRNTEFKVYDNLRYENDPHIIDKLDEILCDRIKNNDLTKIHLAPPEFQQEDEISYAYKEKSSDSEIDLYPDLFLNDLINQPRRRIAQLSKATLKSWKIFKYDHGQDKTFLSWNAYECIVAEVDIEEKTYILSSGHWRAISDELKNKIKDYLQNNDLIWDINYLPENVSIYDHKREQNREEVYNLEAAKNQENLYLFDKAKLTIGGKKDYEVCDLLHNEKHLIHVKRYTSGAASISHIFTQVKFYSDAFSTEKTCREEMREWIQSNPNFINNNKIIYASLQ